MMRNLTTWLHDLLRGGRRPATQSKSRAKTAVPPTARRPMPRRARADGPGASVVARGDARRAKVETNVAGHIQDGGPGKNVLIRNKYVREDAGTHDNLKILDDSMLETGEEEGIDPYNTGVFDRSKTWNSRSRK